MASASRYQVFLSFHGKDVRYGFADHLYHVLDNAGIRTFRDKEGLEKGEVIASNLLEAIRQSTISIPILSMNYASSKWCLNELKEISECKKTGNHTIVPIFYKIEPTNVRNQTGEYAKAFDEEHPKHFDQETVKKWRDALKEIGELDGWHLKEDMYETESIKEIVKIVSSKLNKRLVHVLDNIFGMESHIEKMLELLDIKSKVTKIVGIHGFGGIGKTTIARVVCNTIRNEFDEYAYAFIENVREDAVKHGIHYLQNKLITGILKDGSSNIIDMYNGIEVIQQKLGGKKVLVVLDDVNEGIQAKSLIGDGSWFHIGSKIIITGRDKGISISLQFPTYEPPLMNLHDSVELFSRHAFKMVQPQEDYLDLSQAMVKVTGGLPLALEVIGSSLFLKKKPIWKSMLKKLQTFPNDEVMERLKISYDDLKDPEQQMFLDTACFFIGMKKDIVCCIWEGCGFFPEIGLDILCARCLITIKEDNVLGMHDVLRDLGRDIVRRESEISGNRSRIWSEDEVLDVLAKKKGTNKCVGLTTDLEQNAKSICLMGKGLDKMTKLRLLQLDPKIGGNCNNSFSKLRWHSRKGCFEDNVLTNFRPKELVTHDLSWSKVTENWMGWDSIKGTNKCVGLTIDLKQKVKRLDTMTELRLLQLDHSQIEGNCNINSFLELRWLSWKGCSESYVLTNFCPEKLVVLDLSYSEFTENWMGWNHIKMASNLKVLNLEYCRQLGRTPDLSANRLLEVLIMRGCYKLTRIDTSIGFLKKLGELDLEGCENLEDLPIKIELGASLKTLKLSGCRSLKKVSDKVEHMTSLTTLSLSCDDDAVCLPSTLSSLKLSCCNSLEEIQNLSPSLTSLSVKSCDSLGKIQNRSPSLTSLSVKYCKLKCGSFFSSWRGQNISGSLNTTCGESPKENAGFDENLDSPESCFIALPSHSENRSWIGFSIFVGKGMDSPEWLELWECNSLKKIPYMRDSIRLRKVRIDNCHDLTEIEHLGGYESLEQLHINGADSLKMFPDDISSLTNLRDLKIGYLSIESLLGLSNLKQLWKLQIWGCEKLSEIGGLHGLEALQELVISGCENIAEIHLVDGSKEALRSLDRLPPHISNLKKLRMLDISFCNKLSKILGLDASESLQNLEIVYCENLAEIQCLDRLKSLTSLEVKGCKSLEKLPDLSNLKELSSLKIASCYKISEIPGLHGLESLQDLKIIGCHNLAEIHGLGRLKSLKSLKVDDCGSFEKLPDLSNLKELSSIEISSCHTLSEIPSLDGLESLQELSIWCCKNLTEIHGVERLKA